MATYLVGDAAAPVGSGPRVICHCVNDVGHWGAGFVLSLSAKWPHVERAYRSWAHNKWTPGLLPLEEPPNLDDGRSFALGSVQLVEAEAQLWVANIVGQHRTVRMGEIYPIRYEALERGFQTVAAFCLKRGATAHMPRIGAGLARGSWRRIVKIIDQVLVNQGISATVYDLV